MWDNFSLSRGKHRSAQNWAQNRDASEAEMDTGLPEGWASAFDTRRGRTYYYRTGTNNPQTTWVRPDAAGVPSPPPPPPSGGGGTPSRPASEANVIRIGKDAAGDMFLLLNGCITRLKSIKAGTVGPLVFPEDGGKKFMVDMKFLPLSIKQLIVEGKVEQAAKDLQKMMENPVPAPASAPASAPAPAPVPESGKLRDAMTALGVTDDHVAYLNTDARQQLVDLHESYNTAAPDGGILHPDKICLCTGCTAVRSKSEDDIKKMGRPDRNALYNQAAKRCHSYCQYLGIGGVQTPLSQMIKCPARRTDVRTLRSKKPELGPESDDEDRADEPKPEPEPEPAGLRKRTRSVSLKEQRVARVKSDEDDVDVIDEVVFVSSDQPFPEGI